MFGTIRKHQTWLWVFIITITIISFVSFFNPSAKYSGQGGYNFGTINGERVNELDYRNAYNEVKLQFLMRYGRWPDSDSKSLGFDADRETYQRLFFIQKIKENNIKIDPTSVGKVGNNIIRELGRGSLIPLETFVQQALAPQGITAEDFERYIRHDLGIQQLVSVVGVAGKLVTPAQAQALYVRERQEISSAVVYFNASNYLSSVGSLSPETVAQFYTNQMSAYRVPDRIQVSFVEFPASNFLAQADTEMAAETNLNAIIDQIYLQRGTNYYKAGMSSEEAKKKIRVEVRNEFAVNAATKVANTFATDLYNQEPKQAANLVALAKARGFTAQVSSPFANDFPPAEIKPAKGFLPAAFALTPEEPFAGPLTGPESVYVIALDKKIPSEIPAFEKIKTQVESDCRMAQAYNLARRSGMLFALAATNGLAQGKSFAAIAAESKVKDTVIAPFSLSTRERPELDEPLTYNQMSQPITLKEIVFDTPPGKASNFISTRDGGVVVFVEKRLPVDQAKMQAELPAFTKAVRQTRESQAINLWYGREFTKAMRDTPLAQPRPSSMAQGRPKTQ